MSTTPTDERAALLSRLRECLPKVGDRESVWCSVQGQDLRAAVDALAQQAVLPARWIAVSERLPEVDGECLCWVRVPKRTHGKRPCPEHFRYMALEFSEGGFWIHGGMPQGMVTHWIPLSEPTGEGEP